MTNGTNTAENLEANDYIKQSVAKLMSEVSLLNGLVAQDAKEQEVKDKWLNEIIDYYHLLFHVIIPVIRWIGCEIKHRRMIKNEIN